MVDLRAFFVRVGLQHALAIRDGTKSENEQMDDKGRGHLNHRHPPPLAPEIGFVSPVHLQMTASAKRFQQPLAVPKTVPVVSP